MKVKCSDEQINIIEEFVQTLYTASCTSLGAIRVAKFIKFQILWGWTYLSNPCTIGDLHTKFQIEWDTCSTSCHFPLS